MSRQEQRRLIDRAHPELSIAEQCAALGLSRSTLYYKSKPPSDEEVRAMRQMDELHLMDPTLGSRRLSREFADLGIKAGREKVRSLMRRMRLCCVYRRQRTTVIDKTRYKHPYLLRDLKIERPHQVWAIDITYVPMRGGYMYLCATIDLWSRYIVGWSVSNTMEAEWVCAVVRDAVASHGKPVIINSDQGSQFTSEEYQKLFKEGQPCEGIRISMDGKGRVIDDYNREVLAIEVDTSLPALRVIRVLEQLKTVRPLPKMIRTDNGPEFISCKLDQWCKANKITLAHIQPGKPTQNAYVERFNGSMGRELLSAYVFRTLSEVREKAEEWMIDYNNHRPHKALGYRSPAQLQP